MQLTIKLVFLGRGGGWLQAGDMGELIRLVQSSEFNVPRDDLIAKLRSITTINRRMRLTTYGGLTLWLQAGYLKNPQDILKFALGVL